MELSALKPKQSWANWDEKCHPPARGGVTTWTAKLVRPKQWRLTQFSLGTQYIDATAEQKMSFGMKRERTYHKPFQIASLGLNDLIFLK